MKKHFLDSEAVSNRSFFETIKEMVICVICTGIIVEPKQCNICENCFCRSCIDIWLSKSKFCPFKCEGTVPREVGRMTKNLLEKIIFKCPNECDNMEEMTYEAILKHLGQCEKTKVICPTCGSSVKSSEIKENQEVKALKEQIEVLEEQLKNTKIEINSLKEEIKRFNLKNSASSSANNLNGLLKNRVNEESELGLIDKCEHFKGNYKPIFVCCNKAFPCYICHDEKQNHHYEFSNKVVCLICSNIYQGPICSQCNAYQVYRKKSL